ncbi:MAG: 2-oxoacid:ferredoxin oxidoreductase subunit beta [bacterium]|nr:2-oxoacid:ferredoxin oxidoreductase subunit beta [bacterium]
MSHIKQYLRQQYFPHIWCSGCGNGIALQAVLIAIDNLKLDKNLVTVVSGIGCSSRSAGYVDFNTLHTAHGRAIAFATGVKLANPKMTVIVITGDGDCAAIGGNHLIHAARRNIGLTVVVFNNSTYGMTSGQYSPTTPTGFWGSTAPYGNSERPFDLCKLAEAAGATYVARGTTFHARQLPKYIQNGLQNKGFSFIDIITGCPTYFGRKNKIGGPVEMLQWQKAHAITAKEANSLPPEQLNGKFIIGEFVNKSLPEYCEVYQSIIEKAQAKS